MQGATHSARPSPTCLPVHAENGCSLDAHFSEEDIEEEEGSVLALTSRNTVR